MRDLFFIARRGFFVVWLILNIAVAGAAIKCIADSNGPGLTFGVAVSLLVLGLLSILVILPLFVIGIRSKKAYTTRLKIEIAWTATVALSHFIAAAAVSALMTGVPCTPRSREPGCGSTQVLLVFLWSSAILSMMYSGALIYLGFVHASNAPHVWGTPIRDFRWFSSKSRSHSYSHYYSSSAHSHSRSQSMSMSYSQKPDGETIPFPEHNNYPAYDPAMFNGGGGAGAGKERVASTYTNYSGLPPNPPPKGSPTRRPDRPFSSSTLERAREAEFAAAPKPGSRRPSPNGAATLAPPPPAAGQHSSVYDLYGDGQYDGRYPAPGVAAPPAASFTSEASRNPNRTQNSGRHLTEGY